MLEYFVKLLLRKQYRRRTGDIPAWQQEIRDSVRPFTMTSDERIFSLINAVTYVIQQGIPGAFVECGVWRGGSMMVIARTLLHHGHADRDLYLFDTFEGMTEPEAVDVDFEGNRAAAKYQATSSNPVGQRWSEAGLEDARRNLASTGYPSDRVHYCVGRVEDTLPAQRPDCVALLRLDTDWYQSTMHEMVHLYPAVSQHGIVVIDDYGHWRGSKEAVDEYLSKTGTRCYLHRVDYSGREFVKLEAPFTTA